MYFSEREKGECPRDQEEINETIWGGIKALINSFVENGFFGATYPASCPDGLGPIGTDDKSLWKAIQAEIPIADDQPPWRPIAEMPSTLNSLDLIEFTWRTVGKPLKKDYHKFFTHYHLDFDCEAGRTEFRDSINRIFRRNGLAYNLTELGQIERLAPPVLREELASSVFRTRDAELNEMLESARLKFLDPNLDIRREALEKLWDAWERLKTLGNGADKKAQVTDLLNRVAGQSSLLLRQELENEATALNKIGNNFQIRHSEITQEKLQTSQHVDYLFHRLFSLINLLVKIL